jgi:hypothetical protein
LIQHRQHHNARFADYPERFRRATYRRQDGGDDERGAEDEDEEQDHQLEQRSSTVRLDQDRR